MKRLIVTSLLLLPLASSGQPEHVGRITGTVLDASGSPTAGATAYARNLRGFSGMLPKGRTDDSGHFVIETLPFGQYSVSAGKKDSGYADSGEAFYSGFAATLPQVTITEGSPSADVTLSLGRKAGWLIGTVRDQASGKLLDPCSQLRWKSDSRIYLGGSGLVTGKFKILIPSYTPVTLKVWLWGYSPWFYRGNGTSDSLFVQPGEEVHIDVRLRRTEPAREPTESELRDMKRSMERLGCSTPAPPDKTY